MKPDAVNALYGGRYARQYNSIWPESDVWKSEASHHLRTFAELITPTTRWLDAGCGTGWNLSHFPGIARGGLDLSPDMLEEARKTNTDALFLRHGDLRDDIDEWRDQWDLVSCTGQPWSYVDSMEDIHRVAKNLAGWTAPGGKCLLGLFDLQDFTGLVAPYPTPGEPTWIDTPVITAVIWSMQDHAGGVHRNLVAPAVGYWIDLFSEYFTRIEILRWPHDPPFLAVARRCLLASAKRTPGDTTPAVVIRHPIPPVTSDADATHSHASEQTAE